MRFRVTLKDPDGVDASVDREVERFMESMEETIKETGLSSDEVDSMEEQHHEVVRKHLHGWLQYGEYITVEIDTEAGTCTVVRAS